MLLAVAIQDLHENLLCVDIAYLSKIKFTTTITIAPYIHVMRIRKMLISYVRLDHMLYSINYGNP